MPQTNLSGLTVIVSGMIAGNPGQGGAAWAVLQYVLGLRGLGADVYLIEPLKAADVRPPGVPLGRSENAAYFLAAARRFGIEDRAGLLLEGTQRSCGLSYAQMCAAAARSDAILNVSGMLREPEILERIPVRVYLDLDPAFIQLWHATQGVDMRFAAHNRFVTVGNALGSPECPIPDCGLDWVKTLPPVVLDSWPRAGRIEHDAFTTIANWRGYGSIHHDGAFYGQKAHSLRQFMDLPPRSSERFRLALSIHSDERADLDALAQNQWELIDPLQAASTPDRYADFVRGSKAEFGIAKAGYVTSRCGWFSDRSACYLASGRPVVAQETGFSRYLPCGQGLLPFETTEDALAAVEAITGDYARHSGAAYALAHDCLDSRRVLPKLLSAVGLC